MRVWIERKFTRRRKRKTGRTHRNLQFAGFARRGSRLFCAPVSLSPNIQSYYRFCRYIYKPTVLRVTLVSLPDSRSLDSCVNYGGRCFRCPASILFWGEILLSLLLLFEGENKRERERARERKRRQKRMAEIRNRASSREKIRGWLLRGCQSLHSLVACCDDGDKF